MSASSKKNKGVECTWERQEALLGGDPWWMSNCGIEQRVAPAIGECPQCGRVVKVTKRRPAWSDAREKGVVHERS